MANEIRVPTLGESVAEATVGQWLKKAGEAVAADEPIVELETDKVSVEVPAPAAGVLADISVAEGETVEVGALLGVIDDAGVSTATAPKSETAPQTGGMDAGGAPVASGKIIEIPVPSAGESVTEAGVGEWLKKVGDSVALDEALVELETDKAAQEVMSPVAGKLVEIVAQTGDTVEVGALLAKIEEGAEGSAAASASVASAPTPPTSTSGMPPAPSAQKMMAEKGMDVTNVQGSGKRGQILKKDVMQATDAPAHAAPTSAPSADDGPREERVRMTRLRQTIARRLKDAQDTAAMLTTFNEVDMSAVMDLRKKYKELFEKKHGVKLGFMGFFTKAISVSLLEQTKVS